MGKFMSNLPGGKIAFRPLHFIWIADCSGSMGGSKIHELNNAIRNAIPAMQQVASENPSAEVLVRAVKFSDGARWHVANAVPIEKFTWQDLSADGCTDMGKALQLVAEQLKMPPMTDRALPPVLVLLTDGEPTDDFNSGLKTLTDLPWGRKSVRIGIAIGSDANLDVLQKFMGNSEQQPLLANNAEQLTAYIKWASTAVLKSVSQQTSIGHGQAAPTTNVVLPNAPQINNPSIGDVW